jgi:hypothetical protein
MFPEGNSPFKTLYNSQKVTTIPDLSVGPKLPTHASSLTLNNISRPGQAFFPPTPPRRYCSNIVSLPETDPEDDTLSINPRISILPPLLIPVSTGDSSTPGSSTHSLIRPRQEQFFKPGETDIHGPSDQRSPHPHDLKAGAIDVFGDFTITPSPDWNRRQYQSANYPVPKSAYISTFEPLSPPPFQLETKDFYKKYQPPIVSPLELSSQTNAYQRSLDFTGSAENGNHYPYRSSAPSGSLHYLVQGQNTPSAADEAVAA